MIKRWREAAVLGCLTVTATLGPSAFARGGEPNSLEYPVKAAFLLNFAKFAEWPADSPLATSASVSICVLGRDPFGDLLERTMAGRSAGGRPIVVRRLGGDGDSDGCHVLFISSSETWRLTGLLEALAGQPVITVGESNGFARRGGVIGLSVEDNVARFEVNLAAADRGGLRLSSKLLGVARVIEAPPARGH